MDAQAEAPTKTCITCQLHDKMVVMHVPSLQSVPHLDAVREKVAIRQCAN